MTIPALKEQDKYLFLRVLINQCYFIPNEKMYIFSKVFPPVYSRITHVKHN